MKSNHSKSLAFLLGFSSILTQVVLMRELVSVFYGNEIVYAVILAAWLFWVAIGNFIASAFIQKVQRPQRLIGGLFLSLMIFLPATVVCSRTISYLMRIQTGEIIGMTWISGLAFLLLAPVTMIFGGLFTVICRYSEDTRFKEPAGAEAGKVYLWEALGGGIGGLFFSLVLIRFFSAITVVFFLCALLFSALISLAVQKKACVFMISAAWVVALLCWGSGFLEGIDSWSREKRWDGLQVVGYAESVYGNITITKLNDTYHLYENGLLSFATNDDLSSEEGVHYALLAHPRPRQVLLIGSGLDGSIKEILKHPGVHVTHIELDGKIIEMVKQYMPSEVSVPLEDSRVKSIIIDARQFVKKEAGPSFDVAIVNLGDPYTALINRYYTLEYFQEMFRVLRPGGVLALSVTSSANYLNNETKDFLRSLNTTLKQVFFDVQSIPGDTHVFLASGERGALKIDAELFARRLVERKIDTRYVREYYMPYRMSSDRMDYINEVLRIPGRINFDVRPITYLYNIVLWSTHFNQGFKDLFHKIIWLRFEHLLVVPLIIFSAGWVVKRRYPLSPVTLSIMTTGFAEIIFQIVIILSFQALYGYAYYKIGFIMASFMLGLAFGTLFSGKILQGLAALPPLEKRPRILKIYKLTQMSICLYPLLLPVLFEYFQKVGTAVFSSAFFASVFAMLPVVAGFIGGLQYPLAVYIRGAQGESGELRRGAMSKNAGFLYAMDVTGATVGALVTAAFMIPLLGINAVVYFCAAMSFAVLLLL